MTIGTPGGHGDRHFMESSIHRQSIGNRLFDHAWLKDIKGNAFQQHNPFTRNRFNPFKATSVNRAIAMTIKSEGRDEDRDGMMIQKGIGDDDGWMLRMMMIYIKEGIRMMDTVIPMLAIVAGTGRWRVEPAGYR